MSLKFEWNPEKAAKNQHKHGVSFHEAATIFSDPLSATFPDPGHSVNEERAITIGISNRKRLLIVSHTEREDRVRIISARQLTNKERRQYEQSTL